MKKLAYFLMCLLIILAGCTQEEIKENQVYVAGDDNIAEEQQADELQIEGRIPFQKYVDHQLIMQDDPSQILLTISPEGDEIYLMERVETDKSASLVIKGETREKVRIIKENVATKEQKIVIENIPFVSKVLWNNEENKVAFGGGGRLTIYDAKNRINLMEEKLAQDMITNFFWSPINENKLYSEQPDLANGSIYYVASQKKVEAYETREETYFKGKLDSSYYYGTKWDLANGDIKTVILDKQGKIIKVLTPGKFRDAFQKSLLVVGENGFGLNYIKDINRPNEAKTLTKDYIFDVKFIADGKIIYTTKTEELEANSFYLYMADNSGQQLKRLKVYGGSIAVSPDGKSGYISGVNWQRVDFVQHKLDENENENEYKNGNLDKGDLIQLEEIYTTIRGAMTALNDNELQGVQSIAKLKKYFINSHSPEQWAYFDMEMIFQDTANKVNKAGQDGLSPYMMQIELQNYELNAAGDGASVTIRVDTNNFYSKGVAMDYALELIKVKGNWLVTGFSTFINSAGRGEIEEIVQETVANMQMGKLFPRVIQDRKVEIGQIQFWRSGMPHLSPSLESANAVKVFLRVDNQGKEEIYKLVLEKVNRNSWKPAKLTQNELSSL